LIGAEIRNLSMRPLKLTPMVPVAGVGVGPVFLTLGFEKDRCHAAAD